ncbi:MAG: NYN domain-containing protein [Acidimicrobiales bacterium]
MNEAASARRVVVDGSNLATEGRSLPSLAQLDQAVRAYRDENPDDEIIVVVDASFGYRVAESERAVFEEAEEAGEIVSPPAGAIGRGDKFLLQIADRIDARVLSNDSFQEFHGEYGWLFDEGRLIGGKPVPTVGWIFTTRTPVRGPRSRVAVRDAERRRKPHSAPVRAAIAEATVEAVLPDEAATGRRRRRRTTEGPTEPLNDPLPFITFIADHPLGSEVEGEVESFTSHGAFVTAAGARCYAPVSGLGDPPPRSAKEVVARGDVRTFIVQALDAPRRGIELALPGLAKVAGSPTDETVEAEIDEGSRPTIRRRTGVRSRRRPAVSASADSALADSLGATNSVSGESGVGGAIEPASGDSSPEPAAMVDPGLVGSDSPDPAGPARPRRNRVRTLNTTGFTAARTRRTRVAGTEADADPAVAPSPDPAVNLEPNPEPDPSPEPATTEPTASAAAEKTARPTRTRRPAAKATDSVPTDSVPTRSGPTRSATTKSAGTKSATTKSATTKSAGTESAATESAATESAATKSAAAESAPAESAPKRRSRRSPAKVAEPEALSPVADLAEAPSPPATVRRRRTATHSRPTVADPETTATAAAAATAATAQVAAPVNRRRTRQTTAGETPVAGSEEIAAPTGTGVPIPAGLTSMGDGARPARAPRRSRAKTPVAEQPDASSSPPGPSAADPTAGAEAKSSESPKPAPRLRTRRRAAAPDSTTGE